MCVCADGSAHPTDTGGSLEKTLPPFSPAVLCSRRPGTRFCVMGRTFAFGTGRISDTEPGSRPWGDEIRSNGLFPALFCARDVFGKRLSVPSTAHIYKLGVVERDFGNSWAPRLMCFVVAVHAASRSSDVW